MSKRVSLDILAAMIIGFSALLLYSCTNPDKKEQKFDRKELEESLIEANRHLVQKESEEIDDFLIRNDWKMQKSGSGLRYMVIEKGEGRTVNKGDKVTFDYVLSLLGGDTIETSQNGNPLIFRVGKENVIAGLHEAALMMQEGDSARLIIPPHLAYGLTGLPNKIPARSTLVYDIKLLKIN